MWVNADTEFVGYLICYAISYIFILTVVLAARILYCKCEMPYNPDDLMVQCEECKDWFHPACMNLTPEQVNKLDHFYCSDCTNEADGDKKNLSNGKDTTVDSKVFVFMDMERCLPDTYFLACW
ncbi:hypothetical protein L7F22_006452 [Adiantum nelumboides]|nr:hypothetical protein [Adiantum nelumboides]